MVLKYLIVGMGGFVGTVLRYAISQIPIKESTLFPFNTFMINILGSLCIGLIAFYVTKGSLVNERIILFIKVGICGGFTTFSTFALESGDLIRAGHPKIALLYIILTTVIGIISVFAPELLLNK